MLLVLVFISQVRTTETVYKVVSLTKGRSCQLCLLSNWHLLVFCVFVVFFFSILPIVYGFYRGPFKRKYISCGLHLFAQHGDGHILSLWVMEFGAGRGKTWAKHGAQFCSWGAQRFGRVGCSVQLGFHVGLMQMCKGDREQVVIFLCIARGQAFFSVFNWVCWKVWGTFWWSLAASSSISFAFLHALSFPKTAEQEAQAKASVFFQLTGVLNLFSLCCTGTCRGSDSTVFVISFDQTERHFVWKLMLLAVQDSSR